MAIINRNPWGDQQDSFENMTQKVTKPVVKAVSDAVKAVATDAKQQILGSGESGSNEAAASAGATAGQSSQKFQEEAKKKQELIIQTRQNLDKINAEITRIREEKKKKEQEKVQVEQKKKEEKKFEDQKKQDDPFWKKMLKGKTGSKEGNVRAGG